MKPFPTVAAAGLAAVLAAPALAGADQIFGSSSPLERFADFVTGPFAYVSVIAGLVTTAYMWVMGGELSGFARRMPIIAIAGGLILAAESVVGNLFGTTSGYELPAEWAGIPADAGGGSGNLDPGP